MVGLIDERHFDVAERLFPGIRRFYDHLATKPATFLELVWQYEHRDGRSPIEGRGRARASRHRTHR